MGFDFKTNQVTGMNKTPSPIRGHGNALHANQWCVVHRANRKPVIAAWPALLKVGVQLWNMNNVQEEQGRRNENTIQFDDATFWGHEFLLQYFCCLGFLTYFAVIEKLGSCGTCSIIRCFPWVWEFLSPPTFQLNLDFWIDEFCTYFMQL